MNWGFELEGFYLNHGGVTVPPVDYPTDDFPGLVEVRSVGGGGLEKQYYDILNQVRKYPANYLLHEHTFSGKDLQKIRARHYEKGGVVISNVYGKHPKNAGRKTLASFQINISMPVGCKDGVVQYSLFDYVDIIRRLDREFEEEIKSAGRQPGFFSIKDRARLEYRSLPNFVFRTEPYHITSLLERIQKAVRRDQ